MSKDLLDRATIKFKSPVQSAESLRNVFSNLAKDKQVSIRWTAPINYLEDA